MRWPRKPLVSLIPLLFLIVPFSVVAAPILSETAYLSSGDWDDYYLNLASTTSCQFVLDVPSTGDFDMYLFNVAGYAAWSALSFPRHASDARSMSLTYSQTDNFGSDESFTYTLTASTGYELLVIAWDNCGQGTYTVSVDQASVWSVVIYFLAILAGVFVLIGCPILCCFGVLRARRRRVVQPPPTPTAMPTATPPPSAPAPPPSRLLFCPRCGGSVPPGAAFCPQCGQTLSAS
jgi:hypothetical protein